MSKQIVPTTPTTPTASITPRERVRRAIDRQPADSIPWHFDLTTVPLRKIARHLGVPPDYWAVEKLVGGHLRPVGVEPAPSFASRELGDDCFDDEFGVTWKRGDSTVETGDWGGMIDCPLKTDSLAGYVFPDPRAPGRFAKFADFAAANADLWLNFYWLGIFDFGWHLRGFENLMVDFVANPRFVDDLLDRCLEFNLALMEQLDPTSLDGALSLEDWGSQHGLLMGARIWRRFIKPRVRQMYAAAHAKGLKVFIHTCGDIAELFPDLIEIGVDVVNPVQPEVMDVFALKREFGREITFFGGLGAQSVLPLGTPARVVEESVRCLRELGDGGGYIFGNAGALSTETPLENILALVDVANNQARYLR